MIVSIVTPTLNAARFVEQCLESVKRGSAPGIDVEHVIVDGGSTDGTVELATRFGAHVVSGKDDGIFDAMNKGSLIASGDLLAFVGADDLLLDGALDCVLREYRRGRTSWICGAVRWIDSNGRDLGTTAAAPAWMTSKIYACLGWSCIWHAATYVSRDFFSELGGFNIAFKDAGDYDFFARALARAPCRRIGRPIAAYRITGANNSAVHPERSAMEIHQIMDLYGPESPAERMFYRYALKVWINGRNPTWHARKRRVNWHRPTELAGND